MTDARSILKLISAVYDAIYPHEVELGLAFGGGDMRPRIERFHDCVRSFTKGELVPVEELSYCIRAIHYLSHKPLGTLDTPSHSPETHVIHKTKNALSAKRGASREDKQQLSDAYLRYGVLFGALFKVQADRDMRDRVEDIDETVTHLAEIEQILTQMAQGKGSKTQLHNALHGVNAKALKTAVDQVAKGSKVTPELIQKAAKKVKDAMRAADEKIDAVEMAHLQYSSTQLALFEEGKNIVKQLASSGLNLAGQFVQAAVQTTSKGRTR